MLDKAIYIASKAHLGQTDLAGQPYILHPLRVMNKVNTVDAKIIAVLHDVIEDTNIKLCDLEAEGFSKIHLEALDCLTKRIGENRIDAAHRAASNRLACIVKLADLADNMDLTRIKEPSEKDFKRLEEYKKVREVLVTAMSERWNVLPLEF